MYISNTTQEQRRIIDSALDDMYFKVRRAHNLLGRVWDDYGIEPHLRGAEAARKAMEVEKLDSEVFDLTKSLKPEPREALLAKRREIAQLPDDEAAPQLRELLKGKGV